MIKVGITGGIGSGKSTISKILEILRHPVYYADIRGRWITENDPEVIKAVKRLFGISIYSEDKILNRSKVAEIVFKDSNKLSQLNKIIHPAVGDDFKTWCNKQHSDMIFKEAAIMFESGANIGLQKVICISAPEAIRIERVMQRDKVNKSQVVQRIKNQMSDKKRLELSDFAILNDGKQFVLPQLQSIIKQIEQSSVQTKE